MIRRTCLIWQPTRTTGRWIGDSENLPYLATHSLVGLVNDQREHPSSSPPLMFLCPRLSNYDSTYVTDVTDVDVHNLHFHDRYPPELGRSILLVRPNPPPLRPLLPSRPLHNLNFHDRYPPERGRSILLVRHGIRRFNLELRKPSIAQNVLAF